MEPISAIALSLALGAGAIAGKEVVSGLVKDAYAALKDRIKQHYPKVSVEQLEEAPQSKSRRAVVEEDLANAGAGRDSELADAANRLIELVRTQAPGAAAAIGVDLKDVEAANLRLRDIAASGTGVKVERGRFSGDIDITRRARRRRAGRPGEERLTTGDVDRHRVVTQLGTRQNLSFRDGPQGRARNPGTLAVPRHPIPVFMDSGFADCVRAPE